LSGKAKRVEADQSVLDGVSSDDSDNDTACEHETNDHPISSKGSSNAEGHSSKVPSFKKMDLSYMITWDPEKWKEQRTNEMRNSAVDKTEEGTCKSGQSTGSGDSNHSGAAAKIKEHDRKGTKQPEIVQEEAESNAKCSSTSIASENEGDAKDQKSSTAVKHTSSSPENDLMGKVNHEFLPLVHEDNILRVNSNAYVKLGVIGKGGSCKVYRALTKKCTVVAIKKVKVEGMRKETIEGYANEISLLKRLKGNPAIIQMYDSEVDLRRKSIFVVMELGEVDLNHVLSQRALSDTSKSLNMNFIRLTWQQMLSAVHSIHQEKIIHSDLKPANFLFVRGALKLIDFGIANAIATEDTTKIFRENTIGTLNYMSPESFLDAGEGQKRIGRATDVWSLGCILYEMVYGKTPFAKYPMIAKIAAITNDSHEISFPDTDGSADAAIDAMKQCLRRDPEKRSPIVGKNGLLNEHWFLHSNRRPT